MIIRSYKKISSIQNESTIKIKIGHNESRT